jgi:hypothetical protein
VVRQVFPRRSCAHRWSYTAGRFCTQSKKSPHFIEGELLLHSAAPFHYVIKRDPSPFRSSDCAPHAQFARVVSLCLVPGEFLKARPYHYKDRVVILGDAAHSMVPFYGQGLNCGLEDVRVLGTILRDHNVDPFTEADEIAMIDDKLASALREYSATRHDDLVAICDLAMDN